MVRTRLIGVAYAAVVMLGLVAPLAPVSAQEVEPSVAVQADVEEAQPATQIVRDDDTSETVHRIRRDLVGVALLTTVGLVVFIWHTSPARRLRVATARLEQEHDPEIED